MKNNKNLLRKQYLKIRKELSKDYVENNQKIIDEKAIKFIKENDPKTIVIYYPLLNENEVGTLTIINYCLDNDINVHLPRWGIDKNNDINMEFYKINSLDDVELVNNSYMPKPNNKLTYKDTVDIAFIPLIAFDMYENRLGFGFGYYDRWLSMNKDHIKEIVGLAWKEQLVDEPINKESHDIKLNKVIMN